ncbi:MAG: LysR family transcriptional regulator [Deltaproteobacteria bacterium]|nr:LysR family transcriptional regulator [Deltaproteobacteria bacterium]
MIEMRQLQVFLAVSELLNFSRAAEKINLTQPTVSGHLKTLESYLKVQLVERGGKTVRLTPAGELFLPFARRIFTLQERARKEMLLYAGAELGSLEIGGSNTPGQYILPQLIGLFTTRHTRVKITLKIGDSKTIINQVADGELELGLVGTPAPEAEFISRECRGDELILVTSPENAKNSANPITLAGLKKLPFIVREEGSGTRQTMQTALQKRGLTHLDNLNLIAEMGSAEAIRQAVRSGLGMAIVSSLSVAEDLESGRLIKISLPDGPIRRHFYLIHNRYRRLSPLSEALSRFILQENQ